MLKINSALILGQKLLDPLVYNSSVAIANNEAFVAGLISTSGQLTTNSPFEIHPYKQDAPLENFEKYIIGTFPPISYILDNPSIYTAGIVTLQQPISTGGLPINSPWIPFYHGNQGSMWNFLLTTSEMSEMISIRNGTNGRQNSKKYLIEFLLKNKINYADIIDCTQRNRNKKLRYDGQDVNLNNICPNNELILHILSNPNAKYILFNTSSIFSNAGVITDAVGFVNVSANTKSFDLFVRQCQELGLEFQIRILHGKSETHYNWTNVSELNISQRRTKFTFEIKIKNPLGNKKIISDFKEGRERIFTVVTPFSPAAVKRGRTKANKIVQGWLIINEGQIPSDLLALAYQNFKNNIIAPLYDLNV